MSDMAIETDDEMEASEELEIVDTDEASTEAITQPESDEVENSSRRERRASFQAHTQELVFINGCTA